MQAPSQSVPAQGPTGSPSARSSNTEIPRTPDQLTVEQFANKFKNADFAKILSKADKFVKHDLPHETLAVHEAGIIVVNGKEVQWRHNVGYGPVDGPSPASCTSLHYEEKTALGIYDDGTLQIFKGPHATSEIEVIQGKHMLVRYGDVYLWGKPRPASEVSLVLYYLKMPDGQWLYQGKVERYTYPDRDLRWQGTEFCTNFTGSDRE